MRLLTVRVAGYGPLDDVELDLDAPLHVVHGPNESGKTSLLDFLLSHLFRWEERRGTRTETVLEGLGRFGDPAEGAGEIELRLRGSVHGYPGDGPSLLHELGLEYAGLTGLFCVRSGELELPEKEEGDFWAELKKVLSGLPEGVETLRERARDAAGLTPSTGRLSDAGSPGLRTRYGNLRERQATLEDLAGRLDEISEVAEEIARLEVEKERLERARRARVARLAADLEKARGRLDGLPAVPRRSLQRWERLEGEIEEARRGREEAAREARDRRQERDEAERRADGLREELSEVREAELESRARRLEGATAPGALVRLADPLYWVGSVVLVLAIGVTFFVPSADLVRPVWVLAAGGALLAGAGLFFAGRSLRERRDRAAEERAALMEDAAACGLDVDGPASVPAAVRALESDVHEAERELEGVRARLQSAEERLEERTEALEEKTDRLEEVEDELEALRDDVGAGDGPEDGGGEESAGDDAPDELEAARSRAEEREALEDRVEQIEAELQGLAGRDASAWEDVDAPDDADELPSWSASDLQRVEARLEDRRERHRELRRAFDRAGLAEPEDALTELQECRAEIRDIERDREAGRLAAEIFGTMDQALEERLNDALSRQGDHSVEALLHRVTGRYRELRRDDDGALVAGDGRGRTYPLSHLSRGTRDQVHLALRLGLARAALEAADLDEPGFFLLDDAFLTADWERRERLVAAAADLADEGWQVVYLTCDDHLRDLFSDAGARVHGL